MTARLATPADADYIAERLKTCGQVWSDEAMNEATTSSAWIMVIDPPTGLFWVQLNEADKTIVHAGITISGNDAQTLALYRATFKQVAIIWPQAAILRAQLDPSRCSATALSGATQVARMPVVSTTASLTFYEKKRADVMKALGIK
jgi:hypothetical protein